MVVFTGIMGFIETGDVTALHLGIVTGKALLFFAAAFVFGDRFLPYIWQQLETWMERHEFVDPTSAFTVSLVVALIFAFFAVFVDLHMIIGGFIAGLFLRQAQLDPDIYDHMYSVMYDSVMGFFAPIFFVTVAFELTLNVFTQILDLLILILVVAFISKIIGSWLFTLPTKLSWKEGLVIGFGMNGRGTVEIVIVSIALSADIIGQELFSILVFTAIFTTTLVPPTVKWGVDWLKQADELVFTEDMDLDIDSEST